MTTATWSSRVRQSSDATYQEWRDEFITKLGVMVTAGFLAADETNITPGAGARASVNTEQGYAVYHLSDSLHSTAPVYIRFGFGSGSAQDIPRIQVTVGTSTNGSGVLGGTALSTIASIATFATATTDTARASYMCANSGFFAVNWKQVAQDAFFFINRTCDGAGAITATGALAWWGVGASNTLTKSQAFRYAATAAAYTAKVSALSAQLGFNPQQPSSTLVGSDIQAMMGWTITPAVAPLFGVCGVLEAEVSNGVSFSVTLVGTNPRTYIALNTSAGPFGPSDSSTAGYPKFAMLWE